MDLQAFPRTMARAWRIFTWSLHAMWMGKWPSLDPYGKPWPMGSPQASKAGTDLADGHFCCVWNVQADLDFYAKQLHLNHWRSNNPCFLCQCDNAERVWNEFDATATWRPTTWTNTSWEEECRAHRKHCIFDLPGLSILKVVPDYMHVKHLGVDQRFLGGVLYLLVYKLSTVEPEVAMSEVWNRVQGHYREHRVPGRFGLLKLSMFCDPKNPHGELPFLKGKANQVRHLTGALLSVWKVWPKPDNDDLWALVEGALEMSFALEQELSHNTDFVLKRPVWWKDTVQSFLAVYLAMVQLCSDRGWLVFNLVPKFHYLCHLETPVLAPNKCWNYGGEDLMQKLKLVAAACVKGNKGPMAQNKTMSKYIVALHLLMKN